MEKMILRDRDTRQVSIEKTLRIGHKFALVLFAGLQ